MGLITRKSGLSFIYTAVQKLTQKVWKYAKLASKQVTGGYGAKITAPGEVAPKREE
jgi:hypothetical protein